jgi:hypothetical protein
MSSGLDDFLTSCARTWSPKDSEQGILTAPRSHSGISHICSEPDMHWRQSHPYIPGFATGCNHTLEPCATGLEHTRTMQRIQLQISHTSTYHTTSLCLFVCLCAHPGYKRSEFDKPMTCRPDMTSGLGCCHNESARPLYQGLVTQHRILLQSFIIH